MPEPSPRSAGLVDAHKDLHVDSGSLPGEHPGRALSPTIKVKDIAWLEFQKPDLVEAEAFAVAFGFQVALRTSDLLHLRGTHPGSPCMIVRRGRRNRFVGAAFTAADRSDIVRLSDATGHRPERLPDVIGGIGVTLVDPSGQPVRVVADVHQLPALPDQATQVYNFGEPDKRTNATQRPPREPARIQRLGHVVLQRTNYLENLQWYIGTLGMIVSDFQFYDGQRARGPVMSFIRCDRGATPADHHTLAMTLGPSNRYVHSAYQVCDIDAIAAGGEYLKARRYQHSWGIGRHILGSQIFDYWRDPHGFLVEHFSDGDMFDSSLEPGWAPMTASGLAQWGPPPSNDFLGIAPGRQSLRELRSIVASLGHDNEFDIERLRGLMKVATT